MGFDRARPSLFALGVGLRAAIIGALAFALIEILSTQRLYATALLAAAAGVLVLAELARYVSKGDRMLERFVEGLAAGDFERPAHTAGAMTGFHRLTLAIERAGRTLDASRAERQRQIDYLQTLIDNVSVSIIVLDDDGSVTLANHAARRLAGQPVSRLGQLKPLGVAAAEKLSALTPGERAVVRLANGQRMLASAARFTAGDVGHLLVSLQNIESELDAVELKAWQDVLRVLAHEMMNSLTPISSLAESVLPLVKARRGAGAPDEVADAIDAIARRSSGLVSFVSRYRKMAELPPPVLQTVPLAKLVQRIDQLMSATFAERGISYSSRVEPENLAVHADSELLEQALINLLHNAIDAAACAQQPHIEVSCVPQEEVVAIRVADNGHGLDPASVERIFVPFFTTKPGGSGIGLSLTRQIAHVHRGSLEVAPNEPTGAVFTLLVPLTAPAAR